ncbi:MAG: DUF4010 domain-containing protein [Chloroflexi bacterium]|nr:MAG: DUF4010 domain-containing protein [Chloroflexota bacterium]MBL1192991.1 DUF4010 domain-containing protein [Chloroflexota bacterium]NOH10284.1 MgtC/SapB family protein [Chloroflexota bacterium]
MTQPDLFLRFGVALAIGFLIGLQREFAWGTKGREIVAGERTFALISLSGCLAAMLADFSGVPLILFGVILTVGVMAVVAYYVYALQGHTGLTTEIAILLALMIGILCFWGELMLAAAIGIATTVLLSLKVETDRFVSALTRQDISAALQFAVITAIILPILPNQALLPPPFDVLNPFKIWLMVVFISGINFLGYVLVKLVDPRQGIGLIGLLGGIVSSTAVTLGFSERSNRETGFEKPFALAIMAAWTMMFAKVLVEVGVVNFALLNLVWKPIVFAGLVGLGYIVYLFLAQRTTEEGEVALGNPFDLSSAIKFGFFYGLVLLVARTAEIYFGDIGVLVSSVLSGLVDVDAITLSVSDLSRTGLLDSNVAARAVVLAAMSNTLAKGGMVLLGGSPGLRRVMLPGWLLMLATGIVAALFI